MIENLYKIDHQLNLTVTLKETENKGAVNIKSIDHQHIAELKFSVSHQQKVKIVYADNEA